MFIYGLEYSKHSIKMISFLYYHSHFTDEKTSRCLCLAQICRGLWVTRRRLELISNSKSNALLMHKGPLKWLGHVLHPETGTAILQHFPSPHTSLHLKLLYALTLEVTEVPKITDYCLQWNLLFTCTWKNMVWDCAWGNPSESKNDRIFFTSIYIQYSKWGPLCEILLKASFPIHWIISKALGEYPFIWQALS